MEFHVQLDNLKHRLFLLLPLSSLSSLLHYGVDQGKTPVHQDLGRFKSYQATVVIEAVLENTHQKGNLFNRDVDRNSANRGRTWELDLTLDSLFFIESLTTWLENLVVNLEIKVSWMWKG